MTRSRCCLSLLLSFSLVSLSLGEIRINEISDKGTSAVCNGNDWIELYNSGPDLINMADGYVLHDDKGVSDDNAFTFPPAIVLAGGYMLLCTKMKLSLLSDTQALVGVSLDDPASPDFGISGSDTITLVRVNSQPSSATIYEEISSVKLPNTADAFDVTYAYDVATGTYNYTSTPTPGSNNIITAPKSTEELIAERRQEMAAQNALGTKFFGMDDRGYKVDDAMDEVLQLHVSMNDEDYANLMANKSFEIYQPFESSKVTTVRGEQIMSLTSPGRIRSKGQSTLFMAICMNTPTVPFQIDFAYNDDAQTLFGAEKIYLRHHMGDFSFSRDYAYNRMLARFGLPHLRVRKVEFFINGKKQGFYSLMEAVGKSRTLCDTNHVAACRSMCSQSF